MRTLLLCTSLLISACALSSHAIALDARGTAGGAVGAAGGAVGGAAGAVGGAAGAVGGVAGSAVGAVGGAATGAVGGVGGVASGVGGGTSGSTTGAIGGSLGTGTRAVGNTVGSFGAPSTSTRSLATPTEGPASTAPRSWRRSWTLAPPRKLKRLLYLPIEKLYRRKPKQIRELLVRLDRDSLRTLRTSCRQVLAAPRSFTYEHVQVCKVALSM